MPKPKQAPKPPTRKPRNRTRTPAAPLQLQKRVVVNPPRTRIAARDVQRVCSITDPFCSHANGAKLFSNSSARTIAHQLHGRGSLPTDANGNASMLVCPGYSLFYCVGSVAGSTATYTTLGGGTAFFNAATFRIVSWGVKLRKISAPLSTSGMLRVRTFGDKFGTNFANISTSSYNCDSFEDLPLSNANEVCVVGRRLDHTFSKFSSVGATNPTSNVSDWVSPGWGAVQISVDGGPPSTGVVDFEFYVNYEVTLADSDNLAQLATPPVPDHPLATAAANAVYTASSGIFTSGVKAFASFVERTAAKALTSYVGGPGAAAMVALAL